jgi:hypothetical protein
VKPSFLLTVDEQLWENHHAIQIDASLIHVRAMSNIHI